MSTTPFASPPLSTPWIPTWPLAPARLGELAYAEYVAAVAVTATAEASANVVVTAPAISVDGATALVVEFFAPTAYPSQSIASAELRFFLFQDGVSIGQIGQMITPAAGNMQAPIRLLRRLTPAAGAHTYSIRATQTGGAASSHAGPGGVGQFMPGFIRISLAAPLLSAPPGAAVAVQYGTSLPTNPLDGQEAILVDSLTNPSYQWRFRYNAGSTSAYKWEYIGGSPAYARVDTDETTTTVGSWVNLTTDGPKVTLPCAGDYAARWFSWHYHSADGAAIYSAVALGDSPGVNPTVGHTTFGSNRVVSMSGEARLLGATAGAIAKMRYQNGAAGTAHWGPRQIVVTPIRVS